MCNVIPIASRTPECKPGVVAPDSESSPLPPCARKNRARGKRPASDAQTFEVEQNASHRNLRPGKTPKHHARHFVQHDYHDHSSEFPPKKNTSVAEKDTEKSDRELKKGGRGGVSTPFPERLHGMLIQIEEDGNDDIISWQPHGRCFVIHKSKEFVSEIMPSFFRQTKLTSFQRQLNLYGFSRLTSGRDRGGYYHELFLRACPALCRRMVRTRVKGTGTKAASNPEREPDFYSMPCCWSYEDDKKTERASVSPTSGVVSGMVPCDWPQSLFLPTTISGSLLPHLNSESAKSGTEMKPDAVTRIVPDTVARIAPDTVTRIAPDTITSLPDCSFEHARHDDLIEALENAHEDDEISFEGRIFHYLDSSKKQKSTNEATNPFTSSFILQDFGLEDKLDDDVDLGFLLDDVVR